MPAFLAVLLKQTEARRSFTGPYTALVYRAANRYIDQIFERKGYIQFEISKVQRLKMSKEEIKSFLSLTLFLKATVFTVGTDNVLTYTDRLSGGDPRDTGG